MGSYYSTLNKTIKDHPTTLALLYLLMWFTTTIRFYNTINPIIRSINMHQKKNQEAMLAERQSPSVLQGSNTDTSQAGGLQRMDRWRNSTFRLVGGKRDGTCVLFEETHNGGRIGLLTAFHVFDPSKPLNTVRLINEHREISLEPFRSFSLGKVDKVGQDRLTLEYIFALSTEMDYPRQQEYQDELKSRGGEKKWFMEYDITLCYFQKDDLKGLNGIELAKSNDIIGLDHHLTIRKGSCFIIGFPENKKEAQRMEILHNDSDICDFGRGVGFMYYDCPTDPETSGSGVYDCCGFLVTIHTMNYFKCEMEKYRLANINRGTLISAVVGYWVERNRITSQTAKSA